MKKIKKIIVRFANWAGWLNDIDPKAIKLYLES